MKKHKSIVTVASYGGPYSGNFIPSLLACNNVIHQLGYRSVFIFPGFTTEFSWVPQIQEVADEVYFISYRPYSIANVRQIRRICKEESAALIYSRMSGWDITARLAMPFLPQIWHMEMGLDALTAMQRIKYRIKYKVIGGRKTYHIAISDSTTAVINSFKVKHACLWLPNAIDTERLHIRVAYAISNSVKLLTFAYDPYPKGFDIALDACERLNAQQKCCILYASAQSKTYAYLAKRYGTELPPWLVLLNPTDRISDLYDTADILLSPSRSEGFSYCLAEALYSGLPAVISDIPGTSWAKEMKMVRVFPSGDAEALADEIKKLVEEQATEDAQNYNREIIREKYSLEAWAQRVRAVIENVLA